MKFLLLPWLIFIAFITVCQAQVTISPSRPEIGSMVRIVYTRQDLSAAAQPQLIFSYSNFFEMPGNLPMAKEGNSWSVSFAVPRYAKYASFYIKDGDSIIRPSLKAHYELIFYKNGKPVVDTYLYKAYSLTAQMGKSDSLKIRTMALYEQELALHPQNYAAKLRLLTAKMEADKEKAALYKAQAMQIIAAKLEENPTDMGNINQVTMGYLIMNEGARIDSLKDILLKKYPKSEVAYEYRYEEAYKTKDETERIKKLEQLLDYSTQGESSTLTGIHIKLFEYYAKQKNEPKALFHAQKVAVVKNPWQPKELKNLAIVLAKNDLALETAKMYAENALKMVSDYPYAVIRYFPEYGYIPGYAPDKEKLIKQQTGNILSVLGAIYTKQSRLEDAGRVFKEALALSGDREVFENLGYYYERKNLPKEAFGAYRKILLQLPTDSAALANFKRTYTAWNSGETGYDAQLKSMISDWEMLNLPRIKSARLNKAAPVFNSVYDMQGKLVDPETLKGKIVVLDFWATWCVPCIEGFPYMQQVYNRFKDNKNIIFMITNSGSKNSLQDAQEWVKKNGFTFPFYYNDRKLATAFNVTTIPSTFVIDGTGNIQYRTVGFEGPIMEPKLGLQIKSLLGQGLKD